MSFYAKASFFVAVNIACVELSFLHTGYTYNRDGVALRHSKVKDVESAIGGGSTLWWYRVRV